MDLNYYVGAKETHSCDSNYLRAAHNVVFVERGHGHKGKNICSLYNIRADNRCADALKLHASVARTKKNSFGHENISF